MRNERKEVYDRCVINMCIFLGINFNIDMSDSDVWQDLAMWCIINAAYRNLKNQCNKIISRSH